MHYIRFLKTPKVVRGIKTNLSATIDAKITITTDLGEYCLATDLVVVVYLTSESGKPIGGKGKEFTWKGRSGVRSLDISLPLLTDGSLKVKGTPIRMLIEPKDKQYKVSSFDDIFTPGSLDDDTEDEGGVVAVRSNGFSLQATGPMVIGMEERVFKFQKNAEIHVWEETGHSIARHVWYDPITLDRDAGLVLSSYISSIFQPGPQRSIQPGEDCNSPQLPIFENILSKPNLNIIELGAGCGIVGITLAHMLGPNISQILLTDLDEASEILTHNITTSSLPKATPIIQQVLDWSQPLPPNVHSTKWDLVMVADCTYNSDVVPDLVGTLQSLVEINKEVVVCLAMKIRHDSELVFFDLMREGGFVVKERMVVPLAVLWGEGQEIEIFGFGVGE